jgi:hypothetical protein
LNARQFNRLCARRSTQSSSSFIRFCCRPLRQSWRQVLCGSLAGEKAKAEGILDGLKALSTQRYVSPFDIAVVYAGLGDLPSAFQWFDRAYEERVFRIIELTLPMFDDLRSDHRWQVLVRRIGLLH